MGRGEPQPISTGRAPSVPDFFALTYARTQYEKQQPKCAWRSNQRRETGTTTSMTLAKNFGDTDA